MTGTPDESQRRGNNPFSSTASAGTNPARIENRTCTADVLIAAMDFVAGRCRWTFVGVIYNVEDFFGHGSRVLVSSTNWSSSIRPESVRESRPGERGNQAEPRPVRLSSLTSFSGRCGRPLHDLDKVWPGHDLTSPRCAVRASRKASSPRASGKKQLSGIRKASPGFVVQLNEQTQPGRNLRPGFAAGLRDFELEGCDLRRARIRLPSHQDG